MTDFQCLEPGCREDLISRISNCLTKQTAWLICAVIVVPILIVGVKVWGQSEFYAIDQVKKNTASIETLSTRTTTLEAEFKNLCSALKDIKTQQETDTTKVLNAIQSIKQ